MFGSAQVAEAQRPQAEVDGLELREEGRERGRTGDVGEHALQESVRVSFVIARLGALLRTRMLWFVWETMNGFDEARSQAGLWRGLSLRGRRRHSALAQLRNEQFLNIKMTPNTEYGMEVL